MAINRVALSPEQLALWPSVSEVVLSPKSLAIFRRSRQALELFSDGERLVEIEKQTGIARSQLYYLIRRALSPHPDGRLFGYRALLPYSRIKPHNRESPVKINKAHTKGGATGAMAQLLKNYPELDTFLKHEIENQPLLFSPGPNNKLIVNGLRHIHKAFIAQCRTLGLRDTDYPLNKAEKGIRSLSNYIKNLGTQSFWKTAKASGAPSDKGHWRDRAVSPLHEVTKPYQVVELDGHLLDVRLSISCLDPFGFEQAMELSRIWILVVVDIFTRAIVGYHISLAAEYDRHDVIRVIQKSVEPHTPMIFTIPGLGYGQTGGFPSQRLPELAYALWDELRFDNAKAHLAEDTLHILRDELGCITHAGPAKDPDRRPFIERFFRTLSETMSHRLPSTTGSKPEDLRRILNATNQQMALAIPLTELEQLVEAVLAFLNSTPHALLGGRTPLQALEYWIHEQALPVRRLPEPLRGNLCFLRTTHTSRVSGNIHRGIRPYISFFGARYSSPKLAECIDLIGKPVRVIYHPDDIRTLQVFEANGAEIGILTVTRAWNKAAHSLSMRRHILKLTREGKLQIGAEDDPVHVYLQYLRQHAPRRRKAATKLESAQRIVNKAVDSGTELQPNINHQQGVGNREGLHVESTTEAEVSAKPRRLSIPSGFSR